MGNAVGVSRPVLNGATSAPLPASSLLSEIVVKHNILSRFSPWASALISLAFASPALAVPIRMDVGFLAQNNGAFSFVFDDSTDLGVSRTYTLDTFSWIDVFGTARNLGDVSSFTATVAALGANFVVNPYLLQLDDYMRPCTVGVPGSCTETISTTINGIVAVNFVQRLDYCELLAPETTTCIQPRTTTSQPSTPITSSSMSSSPVATTTVPEPSTLALIVGAVLAFGASRLRRPGHR